jgi:hypothetical protein
MIKKSKTPKIHPIKPTRSRQMIKIKRRSRRRVK